MKQLQKINQESIAAWLDSRNVFEKQNALEIAAEFSPVIYTVQSVGCCSFSAVSLVTSTHKGGAQQYQTLLLCLSIWCSFSNCCIIFTWNDTYQVLHDNRQTSKASRLGQDFRSSAPWMNELYKLFDLTSGWQPL